MSLPPRRNVSQVSFASVVREMSDLRSLVTPLASDRQSIKMVATQLWATFS